MDFSRTASKLPLHTDAKGIVRVGKTRVTLGTVVETFKNGSTCEEIVFQYPVLDLGDVYAVIGFYLKNQNTLEKYLEEQTAEAAGLQQELQAKFPSDDIRKRLLKRRSSSAASS